MLLLLPRCSLLPPSGRDIEKETFVEGELRPYSDSFPSSLILSSSGTSSSDSSEVATPFVNRAMSPFAVAAAMARNKQVL